MGMSTEDFENKECDKIAELIDTWTAKSCRLSSVDQTGFALCALIKILVSNGTLTAKQAERALKENV